MDETTKYNNLEEIHNSLVNGQRRQMVSQINEYGLYDFWTNYKAYLNELYATKESQLDYFSDCVVSYHRITNR